MIVYYFIFCAIVLFCGLGYILGRIDGYSNGIQHSLDLVKNVDKSKNKCVWDLENEG